MNNFSSTTIFARMQATKGLSLLGNISHTTFTPLPLDQLSAMPTRQEKGPQLPQYKLHNRIKYLEAWRLTRTRPSSIFGPGEWAEMQLWWDRHEEHRTSRYRIVNGPNWDLKPGEESIPHGVPDFWLHAMLKHIDIGSMVRHKEYHPLEYLTDIRLEFLDNTDYALVFLFRRNPFFVNEEIRKSFYFIPYDGIGIPKAYESRSSFIEWKPGRNVKRLPDCDTALRNNWPPFFNWLSESATTTHPVKLLLQFEIAEAFKDDLVPRAIDWYTGALLRMRI